MQRSWVRSIGRQCQLGLQVVLSWKEQLTTGCNLKDLRSFRLQDFWRHTCIVGHLRCWWEMQPIHECSITHMSNRSNSQSCCFCDHHSSCLTTFLHDYCCRGLYMYITRLLKDAYKIGKQTWSGIKHICSSCHTSQFAISRHQQKPLDC